MPETSRAPAGRTGSTHIFFLENDDIRHAALGKLVRDTQTDDTAADDDDFSSVFHVLYKTSYDQAWNPWL